MVAHAIIFDLDGTLWDSASWFAPVLGGGDKKAIALERERLVAGGNIIGRLRELNISRTRLLSEAQRRSGAPRLFPGMRNALESLRSRGTPIAVATSLPGSLALPMLQFCNLDAFFTIVVHAGVCRSPKPNPASILKALELLRHKASHDIFYVGDRAIDAEAAERAGISAAWIRHGYECPPEGFSARYVTPAQLLVL